MSWHFSQVLVEEYLAQNCSDGAPSALLNIAPFARDDSCSDRMKGILHRSPFGIMFVPLTDVHGEELLTWYQGAFPAKDIPRRLRGRMLQTISGRKCDGSWQMSLPGTYLPRMSSAVLLTKQRTTLRRWVTSLDALSFPRQTWVLTMFGKGTGFVHTPTCTANYAARSMQKWACAREFVKVFGKPSPMNHEWLMGWPIGWTDSRQLETAKFQSWLRQHGNS